MMAANGCAESLKEPEIFTSIVDQRHDHPDVVTDSAAQKHQVPVESRFSSADKR